jgi:nickel/cobalt transporter (NiCoT) family protein
MAQATVAAPAARTSRLPFTGREWLRLGGMYGTVALIMLMGWALFFHYHSAYGASYAAAGGLAFSFGLRHAFDADHISAVDDTTRYLMQRGKKPLGVGYFFSLGHSTIVIALSLALAVAAQSVQRHLPGLESVGGVLGSLISGTFLMAIAVLDYFILRGILDVWRKTKSGEYQQDELDELMTQRGFINRIMGSRWRRFISDSWQMYPVGVLFGLGFDTATEVGLLAITAAAATGHTGGGGHNLPFGAIIALPLLFTAGMSLMDTTDGVVMAKAYGWAFKNPLRKVYYNMATVTLGIFVAAGVGGVELLQVISGHLSLTGGFWGWLDGLNFEVLGYFIVATFILLWIGSVVWYRFSGIEERYAGRLTVDPFQLDLADAAARPDQLAPVRE